MILSAQSIRERCLERRPPLLEPFVERSVSPAGRSFGLSSASYDVRIDQDVIVLPHGFVLASTIERFNMHVDLAGTVRDKSSWARLGLAVQNTHLDPGWCGYLTVELSNHSDVEIRIPSGEPIAQIVFELLDRPTELPYRGKYYDQERGPQPARCEKPTSDNETNVDHANYVRGYNDGWRGAIAAVRLELAKPHKPADGLFDRVLDEFEREHSTNQERGPQSARREGRA
jgi:dCTP deaminase